MPRGQGDDQNAHNVPLLPRVQGIRSSIYDLTLRGDKLVDRVGGALMDGTLTRKMSGASELKLEILDKGAKLLNSQLLEDGYNLRLDGLGFTYVAYERPSLEAPLILTHEAQVVNRLRHLHGPHKAFRDEMTRAEFAKARVMELKPPRPRFVCPELHKAQPIKDERDARHRTQESKQERGPGIDTEAHLTIEGSSASVPQKELGHLAMQIAEGVNAPFRVCVALIAALMDESSMGAASKNVLQALGAGGAPIGSAVDEITGFLTGKNWTIPGGAIGYFKAHPAAKAYEIAQEVQHSGAGESSKGAANYGRFTAEAVKWVEAYGGVGEGGSITETLRYAFEEKEKEDHWKCITQLGSKVGWRVFESAGWIYFIAEPTLFRSHNRMTISDSTPGVLDTSIKGDEGKSHEEVTVEALAKMWSAPPGSCVQLRRHGPADGAYLVDRIESPLAKRESVCTITLKRPTKPKKEPAPPTRTRSTGTGSGSDKAPADAPPAIGQMIAEIDATTGKFHYQWGGGHESTSAIKKLQPGEDCSGYMSHILWAGGLLDAPATSGTLAGMYEAGEGEWLTIYANSTHVFAKILTTDGWRYFQSGGADNSTGWVPSGKQDSTAGYSARHPKGL